MRVAREILFVLPFHKLVEKGVVNMENVSRILPEPTKPWRRLHESSSLGGVARSTAALA